MARGLIVAAPASGSGKTAITLALLALLKKKGIEVASAKIGPDYIDPAFHQAATGRPCFNLDSWAMRGETVRGLAAETARDAEIVLIEGVMGLHDGAGLGSVGSTADVAALLDLPILLVVNAKGQGATAAAVIKGLAEYRAGLRIAGVIFNQVGGAAHRDILAAALQSLGIPALGFLPRLPALAMPERHLGLRQAGEMENLAAFLAAAADAVAPHLAIDRLLQAATPITADAPQGGIGIPAPGQRIAVARDVAFAFAYPAQLEAWRRAGAALEYFSPLADEAPGQAADAVFLPGGYPELHAGKLAANTHYQRGLCAAAARGAAVYGECGGYMALGEALIDAAGASHRMAGLLPVVTSFAKPKLHLGYRCARLAATGPLGAVGTCFAGHEFHYTTAEHEAGDAPLFQVRDSRDNDLGFVGCQRGTVMGSYLHLIDRI
jgi:cobyrinic acid a,c-diamide synthase